MCCACIGNCCHTGPCTFCDKHKGYSGKGLVIGDTNGDNKQLASTLGTALVIPRSILRNNSKRTKRKGVGAKAKSKKKLHQEVKAFREYGRRLFNNGRGDALDGWHWPYQRDSDGPEYACPHGVGHSMGIHGCDGCCGHSSFAASVDNKWDF